LKKVKKNCTCEWKRASTTNYYQNESDVAKLSESRTENHWHSRCKRIRYTTTLVLLVWQRNSAFYFNRIIMWGGSVATSQKETLHSQPKNQTLGLLEVLLGWC